jgi:hypothetical protein
MSEEKKKETYSLVALEPHNESKAFEQTAISQ